MPAAAPSSEFQFAPSESLKVILLGEHEKTEIASIEKSSGRRILLSASGRLKAGDLVKLESSRYLLLSEIIATENKDGHCYALVHVEHALELSAKAAPATAASVTGPGRALQALLSGIAAHALNVEPAARDQFRTDLQQISEGLSNAASQEGHALTMAARAVSALAEYNKTVRETLQNYLTETHSVLSLLTFALTRAVHAETSTEAEQRGLRAGIRSLEQRFTHLLQLLGTPSR